ncbi:MAG TPA: hypothetical protein VFM49_29585, partial [Chloroflexia bacterium]|nr:hypothetical protein [Chloroflexia bacterium]
MHTVPRVVRLVVALALLVSASGLAVASVRSVSAAAVLTIKPISWGVIGLDSNKVTDGPNTYQTGAQVCNTGDAAATNLSAGLVWTTTNANINIAPGSSGTVTVASLGAGQCTLLYFPVAVTRTAAAYDTSRGYQITATAQGLGTVSTPAGRELYVEHLVSQNRNSIGSVTGPAVVVVGQTYDFVVTGGTATQGYEQMVFSTIFPNNIFKIEQIAQNYSAPPASTNWKEYADACGWDPVVGSA